MTTQVANQTRAHAALRRGQQLTKRALTAELEWAKERIENGPRAEVPLWEQVAADLERVLARRTEPDDTPPYSMQRA